MSGNEMAVAFYDFNHANMTDTWLNGPEVENWIKSYAVAKGYTDSVNVTEFITIAKAQLHKALNTLTGDHDLTPPTGRFALYPNERDSADIVNGKIR